jgi:hypothetical protein
MDISEAFVLSIWFVGSTVPPKVAATAGIPIARYFSLERMLSIYSQMVSIVEGRRAHGHGTVSIYATVSNFLHAVLYVTPYRMQCPGSYEQVAVT